MVDSYSWLVRSVNEDQLTSSLLIKDRFNEEATAERVEHNWISVSEFHGDRACIYSRFEFQLALIQSP